MKIAGRSNFAHTMASTAFRFNGAGDEDRRKADELERGGIVGIAKLQRSRR